MKPYPSPVAEPPLLENTRKQNHIASRYTETTPGSHAEEEMVKEHIPLVKNVVGRLAMSLPTHVDPEDLYSSGMVGLLAAVRNFNPQAGSTFESYARVRIRGTIIDELRRMDWVPRSVHDKARHVQEVLHDLEQKTGRIPSNEEMAGAMNLSLAEYEQLLEEIRPATFICLDAAPSGGESDAAASPYECIADPSQEDPRDLASRRELSALIADRIRMLPEMQKKVLALYYYEDMRMREIAEVFGVTESRVCQIHSQAILAIKAHLSRQTA